MQTLVAFESAARSLSFTQAATELNLTQPAISQQVKILEGRLDVALFQRSNNRIRLTEAGESFAAIVAGLLDQLSESVEEISRAGNRTTLTVSLLPSFASTWFSARIGRFQSLHPEIDLIILSTIAKTGFGQEEADVAVRWGAGGAAGLFEEKLLDEEHILAASPAVAAQIAPDSSIEALHSLPFLHDTAHTEWQRVIEANGGESRNFENGLYFGDSSATLNALVSGHGVGVVRDVLANQYLRDGRLVRLPFASVKGPFSYYFLCPTHRLEQPAVQAFRSWLKTEIESP
ncbi:hypothetical protein RA19_18430 [Leisingera sp. ANG-M1]|nr:hypothetical protein RA19_18430 [Leisingera sp. ANG-M1]